MLGGVLLTLAVAAVMWAYEAGQRSHARALAEAGEREAKAWADYHTSGQWRRDRIETLIAKQKERNR